MLNLKEFGQKLENINAEKFKISEEEQINISGGKKLIVTLSFFATLITPDFYSV